MFVLVNGEICLLPKLRTLDALLRYLSPEVPFVVACNEEVVPRGNYEECIISTGDRIDIVHPTAGG
jgi:thiamine biosynthesis protein ThiS